MAMFHHMLEKNQQQLLHDEFSFEDHRKFITELIAGKPGEDSPEVSILLHSLLSLFYCSMQHI